MTARTAKADAAKLRAAEQVFRDYGVPASANVCQVVADAIEAGKRTKVKKSAAVYADPRNEISDRFEPR